MIYNGKEVWTEETYDLRKMSIGDYVEEAVVDWFINCLPPVSMSAKCSQCGEPHSMRYDEKCGKYRSTYTTFKKIAKGVWKYCGDCFAYETEQRGNEPPYVKL